MKLFRVDLDNKKNCDHNRVRYINARDAMEAGFKGLRIVRRVIDRDITPGERLAFRVSRIELIHNVPAR